MKKVAVTLLAAFIFQLSTACSCMSNGDCMCKSFEADTMISLVGLFKKIDTLGYGFKAVRLQTFYGTETRDTLMIWGDNGALCRIYDGWQVGDTMMLMLHDCDTAGNIVYNPDYWYVREKPSDYHMPVCGVYAAEFEDGKIKGYIDLAQMQTFEVSHFANGACFKRISVRIDEPEEDFTFSVGAAGRQLQVKIEAPGEHNLRIYDISGREVKTAVVQQGYGVLDAADFNDGVYVAAIAYQGNLYRSKFAINK